MKFGINMSETSDTEIQFRMANEDVDEDVVDQNDTVEEQRGQGDVGQDVENVQFRDQAENNDGRRKPADPAPRRHQEGNVRNHPELEDWRERLREDIPSLRDVYREEFRRPPHIATTIRPEPYTGTDDWEEYFSHFEDCAELGRWSREDRVLTLAACLRGPARTFYISLPAIERRSYRMLVRRLEERFGSTRQQNRWLSRFETRKRSGGETVAALGDDLRQMAQKAYSNLDSTAQEVLALNQLYKSVSLEMKCRCVDRECRTVAEAVDVIERYEALLGESSEKKKNNVRVVTNENSAFKRQTPHNFSNHYQNSFQSRPQVSDSDRTIKQLIDRIDKLENRSAVRENRQGNTPFRGNYAGDANRQNRRTCFICDSPEHFYRRCPMYTGPRSLGNKFPHADASQNVHNTESVKQPNLQGNGNPLTQ